MRKRGVLGVYVLEETDGVDVVVVVEGEAVVNAGGNDKEIPRSNGNADPLVSRVAHIKVATPLHDEADLFVFVQVPTTVHTSKHNTRTEWVGPPDSSKNDSNLPGGSLSLAQ